MPIRIRTVHVRERQTRARLLHLLLAIMLSVAALCTGSTQCLAQECVFVLEYTGAAIAVVDPVSKSVLGTVPLPDCSAQCRPVAFALTHDATRAYVVRNDGIVQVLDLTNQTAIKSISLANGLSAVTLNPAQTTVYVANGATNSVSVIAVSSNQVTDTVQVGSGPRVIAVSPDNATVLVGSSKDDRISVIRAADDMVLGPISVPHAPAGIAIASGGEAFATSDAGGVVSVLDVAGRTVAHTIAVGHLPRAIALTPDEKTAYVTNSADGTISPIDIATQAADPPITVGGIPVAIALSADAATAYVADISAANRVSVIDTATRAVSEIDMLQAPLDVALAVCPADLIPTATPTPTQPPTPTAKAAKCPGDCNGDGEVVVSELIIGVNIALGNQPVSACRAFDTNGNGQVEISELISAVAATLNGCPT